MLFFVQQSHAQSLGDPIVHITFGSGVTSYGPPLAADSGHTNYQYAGSASPEDGQYGIYTTTAGLNTGWIVTNDHSGSPNGYMMVVNADFAPGLFYTRRVDGLCSSTTYQFAAWIKNILNGTGILPNVSFSLETLDGHVLGNFQTNNIPANNSWIQYAFTFATPDSVQSVIIKMTNHAPGGAGNDIAIDDITFSPYGTLISAQFDQSDSTLVCLTAPKTLTIKTLTPLDKGYAQRLQRYSDGKWTNHGPPTTSSAFTFVTPDTPGHYSYRITKGDAVNIEYSKCVVSSNLLDITVVPPPQINFTVADTACEGDTTVITNNTAIPGVVTVGWNWDFGDGRTSTEKNPRHLYTSGGDYTITLTATINLGCSSVFQKTIHIIPHPNVDFDSATFDCNSRSITFTDKTVVPDGTIIRRKWDFGDGDTSVVQNAAPFQHTYDTTGTYHVQLSIITNKGCLAVITKDVIVPPAPQVNFILPEVCLADSYAQFKDSSFIADNTALTYLWNFGDDNADVTNQNTSTARNPRHKYTEAKQYQVTLTVTSAAGCQQTSTKTFTVNGSIPKADFDVLNPSSLCSDRDAYFSNKSTVDFGNITKVIWFYDTNDLSVTETDENPYPGKLYHHKYPEIHLPQATKNYQVKMLAFSGESCVSEKDQSITILAAPVLTFNAPDSVCLNFGQIQFAAQEGTNINGSGTYSGTGVTAAGLFDPLKAGVGIFDISYIYTSGTGCTDTIIHKIKVNPVGTVDAGPDVSILAGGTTSLHAKASGDDITYAWLPATGLSSTAIPNPVVTLDKDVTYTLTVTNKYGCSVSDQVTVKVLQEPVVPNTFTPNGDGVNDNWVIKYLDSYSGCTVDIFNRNGQKVFTSVNYSAIGWDGRFKGQDLPVGVYYYVIDPKHGRKALSGYITIIR
ncbi:PKD domain-containing protein [Mucilaginibacter panaciglaebae]|uniref:Gliding motility-associated-like protein n=1 Tax=Mucilaginibacter panaciglaebae TaxID=502331 RepID=A0ABP7X2J1_9SPHI